MGAKLITSLQEIRDFRAAQGRRYPMQVNFAISCDGNNQWMPKSCMHLKTLGCDTTGQ